MVSSAFQSDIESPTPPLAVVLGTNEIASAVAHHMLRAGFGVVMCDDPDLPVIRRGMAFHDALHGDLVSLDGLSAIRVDSATLAYFTACRRERVVVTDLGLVDLLAIARFDALVDARMNKYAAIPDLRHLAGVSIGLGPGFAVDVNCDVAIETHPTRNGAILDRGATSRADREPARLGSFGRERLVYSHAAGLWHSAHEIGMRAFRGMVIGHLAGEVVMAPIDGVVRGLARDGIEVPAGVKIVEIDPRGRGAARWTGIDERARWIAEATLTATVRRLEYDGLGRPGAGHRPSDARS